MLLAPGAHGAKLVSPPKRVLVADDSSVVREVVVKRLQGAGIDAQGRDSVASARESDPASISCALLDLDLGDGTGIEIAQALRAARPELPVAFFSSGAAPELVAEARALGPVFEKPGDLDLALAWVERFSRTPPT
jgi:DNA-binding NtrC family response regulator